MDIREGQFNPTLTLPLQGTCSLWWLCEGTRNWKLWLIKRLEGIKMPGNAVSLLLSRWHSWTAVRNCSERRIKLLVHFCYKWRLEQCLRCVVMYRKKLCNFISYEAQLQYCSMYFYFIRTEMQPNYMNYVILTFWYNISILLLPM